jgi:uncharacterized protein YbjQ (UPF0145 family)
MADILVTTGLEVEGYRITKHLGVVRGLTVRTTNLGQTFLSWLRGLFGGRIKAWVQLCETSRQEAFDLMVAHALSLGANAVIGMRYDSEEVAGLAEVLAYGTAVVVEPKAT